MNDPSVKDVLKQVSLSEFDGEVKSLVTIAINHDNEPEIQVAIAPGTTYSIVVALEILKLRLLNKLYTEGITDVKDRE